MRCSVHSLWRHSKDKELKKERGANEKKGRVSGGVVRVLVIQPALVSTLLGVRMYARMARLPPQSPYELLAIL